MQDGIIKGTGNSRYLKSISNFLTQYPTYQDFVAALVAGTLPIDLNGINETGWDQLGTALNKANLLSDETAAAYGDLLQPKTPGNPVVDDALRAAAAVVSAGNCEIEYGSYAGTGNYSSAHKNTLDFSGEPRFVIVCDNRVGGLLFMFRPGTIGLGFNGISAVPGSVNPEWDFYRPKSVSWYSSESAVQQFNASGRTYSYAGFYGSED